MRFSLRLNYLSFALLMLLAAGCLPSSCNRIESRALFSADSTSRTIAAGLSVDTLRVVDSPAGGPELSYPRTAAYAPDGTLWVSDAEVHRVIGYSRDSTQPEVFDATEYPFPFIAGVRGESVFLFSPDRRMFVELSGGQVAGTVPIPEIMPARSAFQYAATDGDRFFYKVISEDAQGVLLELDRSGREIRRHALTGPYWRFAGLLRLRGDSLLSLSGYRPVVHVYRGDAPADTMHLVGFDSPMLARSRSFALGEVKQPPLLTASATVAGEFIFALNMRPGWLNVDVYDGSGHIRYILTEPSPAFDQNYFPTDLAVRALESGEYELAVTVTEPEARVDRYLWVPQPVETPLE